MNKLFKKAICMTDIHWGLRNNAVQHNIDCMDFIDWFINEGKLRGAETCIFLGDWGHHRSNINILTLTYTMDALRKLNNAFEQVIILVGNHDLFWRERRDAHGLVVASEFKNIILIDHPQIINDVALVPWLVEDEWKSIGSMKAKYMFGHLELPGFKMNALVEMPDHGGINKNKLTNFDYVFSGHFHKRQVQGCIHYIGNPFGHNYADIWDFERGAMFLEWDKEPEYINYADGPRFMSLTLSSLLENPELYLKPKSYIQVMLDVDITYEEASYLRETFIESYNVRELKLIQQGQVDTEMEFEGDIEFMSVDQIVLTQLVNIESDSISSAKLMDIYDKL
jgi:DNA repair exonuclease SbcCD nuclease subunit